MPNPGKPHALKVITGSRRIAKDAPITSTFPVIDAAPPAPQWLPNAHAVSEWNRLAPLLVANRLLTEPALQVLGHVCALHGVIVERMGKGQPPNAALISVYRGLINDFGLTPVAQVKVRPAGGEPSTANPFARNGKRPLPGEGR